MISVCGSCNEAKNVRSLTISRFLLPGIWSALGSVPLQDSILCVGYKEGDVQIGVTGKRKLIGEGCMSAAEREVREELSIHPSKLMNEGEFFHHDFTTRWYTVQAKDCLPLPSLKSAEKTDVLTEVPDDQSERIGVFVHGSSAQLQTLLLSRRVFSIAADQAATIAIIPCLFVRQFLRELEENGCRVV